MRGRIGYCPAGIGQSKWSASWPAICEKVLAGYEYRAARPRASLSAPARQTLEDGTVYRSVVSYWEIVL